MIKMKEGKEVAPSHDVYYIYRLMRPSDYDYSYDLVIIPRARFTVFNKIVRVDLHSS